MNKRPASKTVSRPKTYIKSILIFILVSASVMVSAQSFRVLIFHKTNGYRHTGAINAGNTMIKAIGTTNSWTVDDTQDPTVFNPQNLSRYSVVV